MRQIRHDRRRPVFADGPTPGGYGWPVAAHRVIRGFDPPVQRWLRGHRGVDLAAAAGTLVRSAGAGVIRFAGEVAGKPVVSVAHPDGVVTTYEPVIASIRVGAPVLRGSPIGTLAAGHPGCDHACLHWGARRGTGSRVRYLDPRVLLGVVRMRLKPVDQPDRRPTGPGPTTPG